MSIDEASVLVLDPNRALLSVIPDGVEEHVEVVSYLLTIFNLLSQHFEEREDHILNLK